jgi:hypothetical protein
MSIGTIGSIAIFSIFCSNILFFILYLILSFSISLILFVSVYDPDNTSHMIPHNFMYIILCICMY